MRRRGGEEQAGSHHDALKLLRAVAASPSSSHTLKQETLPSMWDWTDPAPSEPPGNRLHARHPRRGSPHLHDHAPEILHRRLLRIRLARRGRRNGSPGPRTDEQVWRHPRHGHRPVSPPSSSSSCFSSARDALRLTGPANRCMTSCLLCFLASAYPRFALLFQFLISLDFSSHYIHMYA